MRVISREVLSADEFINSHVLVNYLIENSLEVKEKVLDPIEKSGYQVIPLEIKLEYCYDYYWNKVVEEKVNKAKCAIIVLSHLLMEKENMLCLQTLLYEIGLMESKGLNICLFFLDIADNEIKRMIQGTPIAMHQGGNNIVDVLNYMHFLKIPPKRYIKDAELNKLVLKRIRHVKIIATLDIRRGTLQNIWRDTDNGWGEDEPDFNERTIHNMLSSLFEELNIGVIVIRFGKEDTIAQKPFDPYLPESELMLFNSPAQYEKSISPKLIEEHDDFVFLSDSKNEIITTIKLEFILPVHDILGTSFKPYLSARRQSRWKTKQLLSLLLEQDECCDSPGTDIRNIKEFRNKHENRIYFLIAGPSTSMPAEVRKLYGNKCNYIYPQ